MARQPARFVIQRKDGAYFDQMYVLESKEIKFKDVLIGVEETHRPGFKAGGVDQAAKFDTEKDAIAQMSDPQYGGPESFAGCSVVSEEA